MPIPNMNMSSPEIFFPEVQDGVSYGDLWCVRFPHAQLFCRPPLSNRSLFLPARTPVTTVPEALIRLTNVALDEDIQGPDSRTVLRVTWPDPQCPEKTLNSVLCSLGDGVRILIYAPRTLPNLFFLAGAISHQDDSQTRSHLHIHG
jgi:hypothetical protein